jgi:hypothetical protein
LEIDEIINRLKELIQLYMGTYIRIYFVSYCLIYSRSLPVLQTLFEFFLVSISVDPNVHTISFSLAHPPHPDVAISLATLPHSRAVFKPVEPLALVKLPIWPAIFSCSLRLAVYVGPLID